MHPSAVTADLHSRVTSRACRQSVGQGWGFNLAGKHDCNPLHGRNDTEFCGAPKPCGPITLPPEKHLQASAGSLAWLFEERGMSYFISTFFAII